MKTNIFQNGHIQTHSREQNLHKVPYSTALYRTYNAEPYVSLNTQLLHPQLSNTSYLATVMQKVMNHVQ